MSEEREVEATAGKVSVTPFKDLNRDQKKARLATILDRGFVHDRLMVDLPSHLYGEWANNEATEISRMQSMGFEIDLEHGNKRALHGQGDGKAVVGDVVFMTAPIEVKEIIDELRMQKFVELNGKPNRVNRTQKEEAEYSKNAETSHGLPTINESSHSEVDAASIKNAIFTK